MPSDGWTFSNGDHLPQGALLELPTWFVQTDEEYYKGALDFDGFRFVDDAHPEANPSDIFTSFGHGNHAW
jgi:cytochrome P450